MVNTRRSETVSPSRRHPITSDRVESDGSSITSDAEGDRVSQESESWSSQYPHWSRIISRRSDSHNRVRELRNRFVCTTQQRTYSRTVKRRVIRSCQADPGSAVMPVEDREHVYAARNMIDGDSEGMLDDLDQDDSDFVIFTPSASRAGRRRTMPETRSLRERKKRTSDETGYRKRMRSSTNKLASEQMNGDAERSSKRHSYSQNSALRPDDSSDEKRNGEQSSDEKPDIESMVRRSTRQRKLQYNTFNTSWITEHQMIRGYPKLKQHFESDHEEDTKENRHHKNHSLERNRETENIPSDILDISDYKITRSRRNPGVKEVTKKYVYEYMTRDKSLRSRRGQDENDTEMNDAQETVEQRDSSDAKPNGTVENGTETAVNGEPEQSNSNDADDAMDQQPVDEDEDREDEEEEEEQQRRPVLRQRVSRRRRRCVIKYSPDDAYSPIQTRSSRKICADSDSTSDDRRDRAMSSKYKLRQRKPKPEPKHPSDYLKEPPDYMKEREAEVRRSSLRRRCRRRRRSSSSSSSTTSEDERPKTLAGNTTLQLKPTRSRVKSPPRGDKGKTAKDSSKNDVRPIDPITLDASVTFKTIGGLEEQVKCLREMVVLPMLYPEIFKQFSMQPPKGVLFHGPPGTGKTLMARALANECSFGARKVSFFMRKGGDLFSKWFGQTEKQLTQLFEQAAQMKPSIIFFDELDGLAPARSTHHEQVHVSVVSCLLALMDGLDIRSDVIVIGATNRPDAIDPALRRPGRFDRELFFPLPATKQREDILKIQVEKWPEKPALDVLATLAERSAGYCGADLRSLCTEAVLQAVRRTYPQLYTSSHRLLIDPTKVKIEQCDFVRAATTLVPAGARMMPGPAAQLPPVLEPLLSRPLTEAVDIVSKTFTQAFDSSPSRMKMWGSDGALSYRPRLLITGEACRVAAALMHRMEHVHVHSLSLTTLYSTGIAPEQACVQALNEARRTAPSVVYIADVDQWWNLAGTAITAIVKSQLTAPEQNAAVMFLATADKEYSQLSTEIASLFSEYRGEVLHVDVPTKLEREQFFRTVLVTAAELPPIVKQPTREKTPEPLPRAPTPPPIPLTPGELQKLYDKEEETLIELRIFLRDVCKKLARNKAFYMFTKPVNLEEVPDYLDVVKKPMDLETMMTKVDLHRYASAQEFLVDVDLIQHNALSYNPDISPADKQIRHRACWFRDYAYALIKAEMDTDFEDNCRKIAKNRKQRNDGNPHQFLPPHIRALAEESNVQETEETVSTEKNEPATSGLQNGIEQPAEQVRISPARKRRVPPWARGYLSSSKKKRRIIKSDTSPSEKLIIKEEVDAKDSENSKPTSLSDDESKDTSPTPTRLSADNGTEPNKQLNGSACSNRSSMDVTDNNTEQCVVLVDHEELERLLIETIEVTSECTVSLLLDLYTQYRNIVDKYRYTVERQNLPKEFQQELSRFIKCHHI